MIEAKIQEFFIERKWRLSLAESCTGGALAARLVAVPDCSQYFLGSVVAYSNASKEKILHVKSSTLTTYGAVSEQTALEMATRALEHFESHFALSTTGIAGPTGATEGKPVGTVCFALVSRFKEPISWTGNFSGGREEVIEQAVEDALGHLWEYVV